jgi:hypothetical protein
MFSQSHGTAILGELDSSKSLKEIILLADLVRMYEQSIKLEQNETHWPAESNGGPAGCLGFEPP